MKILLFLLVFIILLILFLKMSFAFYIPQPPEIQRYDFKCFNECTQGGYNWDLCKRACSY
jgi:hypothetical protein